MAQRASSVNDMSGPTRTYAATWFWAFGVLAALFFSVARDDGDPFAEHGAVIVVVFVVGLLALPVGAVRWTRWLRRTDRQLKVDLGIGSHEIVTAAVDADALPGRVLRTIEDKRAPAWAASTPDPAGATSLTLVATVLSDPPRRVVASVPHRTEGYRRSSPVKLLVHPRLLDVAVLDDRARAAELDRLGADPRWDTAALPSDSMVLGGYSRLLAVAAVAFVVGAAVSSLVLAVG